MDWGSIVGLVVALASLILGQSLEGGHLSSLMQPAAFIIVVLGTFGAVLLQTSLSDFIAGLKMIKRIFFTPKDDRKALMQRINQWSTFARKEGIFQLEKFMNREKEDFIRKGLQLMIDGTPPERIREIGAIDIHFYEQKERRAARIWSAAGGYSPTIGILGAVLGLIHVMENLSDPEMLGNGIAIAFVATIYGVAFANLIFLPIANKLKALINNELMRREMLLNAWVSIARGDHPKVVAERLESYMH